jgi:hypothetical protein
MKLDHLKKGLYALRCFAVLITLLIVAGHAYLGFETSWAQAVAALLAAYSMEFLLEVIHANVQKRSFRFSGRGISGLIDFLLSAHIAGCAVGMLLWGNERLLVYVFGGMVAIGSKTVFRAPVGNGNTRHFFNPSNLALVVTLTAFPWVGMAPPYQFTEALHGIYDWILPLGIMIAGILLNYFLAGRLPVVFGWLGGFLLQGAVRSLIFKTPLILAIQPMTGFAFWLYTFFMITDPGTTPLKRRNQAIFGISVAVVYGILSVLHIVYTFFYALAIVCALRGIILFSAQWLSSWRKRAANVGGNELIV